MKVSWFSPLPPAQSAIATYATVVLPELAQHAEVVAWSEDPEAAPVAGVEVRHYRTEAVPWDTINESDVSIYHIGNHLLFHEGIWELSRRQPGVMVLHDARLQELVVGGAAQRGDRQGYLDLMRRHYGPRGTAAAEDVWDGRVPVEQLVDAFPLTAAFVERALGTVVHSVEALKLTAPHAAGPLLLSAVPYLPTAAQLPKQYAQQLVQFLAVALASRNRCNVLCMADRTAAALRQIAGAEADEWALQRLSGAILGLAREQRTR